MTQSVPGWFPDPDGTPQLRWWDGNRWTGNVAPAPAAVPPAPATAPSAPSAAWPSTPSRPTYPPSSYPEYSRPQRNASTGTSALTQLWRRNRYSTIATAVAIVYILLALESPIVLIGILPVLFTARAWRAKEPLAVVATIACALSLIFLIISLKR